MTNENTIMDSIRAGDPEAYRELVDRYQTGLIIHCENIVKDRSVAEDMAQEAFVKAYYQLHKFDETKGKFSTWLYRIATNIARDYLRGHKKTVDIDEVEELADPTPPPILEDDEKQRIRQAVQDLEPPKYAAIIQGYFWEGKSYKQLASEQGTTTNSIGVWMSRAKAQLKEKLS